MLDIFTPEQKASILAQIMKEESTGASLRDCCKAQGITLQTFIDWKARAQKHNQFDTLHLNGKHEQKASRFRHEKPKTAFQLALETAQRKSYPEDNPEDIHALEHGEPEPVALAPDTPEPPPAPPAPAVVINPTPEPEAPASGPMIEPVYPIYDAVRTLLDKEPESRPVRHSNDEVPEMPKATDAKPATKSGPRGVAAAMLQRMPWLAVVDRKTEKVLGPKPENNAPGYRGWIAHRKTLMTEAQQAEIEAFFDTANRGKGGKPKAAPPETATPAPAPVAKRLPKPAQIREQKEIAAARANGSRPVSPEIEALAEQHAHVSAQLVQHDARHAGRELSEIDKLKRALTALTLENLQLRGLL